uniref:Uncharacterized protein n=1 Tax=Arundo donax TaxID=35708 RepID=A0A0A9C2D0_ARUDO
MDIQFNCGAYYCLEHTSMPPYYLTTN